MPDSKPFVVYQHRRCDTGEICYYGCGVESRALVLLRNSRSKEHRKVQKEVGLSSEILERFGTREEALAREEELIAAGRRNGYPLLNKISGGHAGSVELGRHAGQQIRDTKVGIFAPGMQKKAGSISGSINGPRAVLLKTGIHSDAFKPRRSALGKVNGKLPWWNQPDTGVRRRSITCPGEGFVRGRGNFSGGTEHAR